MLSRLRHRQRGFTLIELLIVVAIIGIIAALLIPNFLDALQKAKQKRTLGDAKSIGTSMFSWLTDQAGAAAAGASATGDVNLANFASTTQADLTTVLVSQYIQQIPVLDGWKHQYSYYCNYTNPLGGVGIIAVLSYGRDGKPGGGRAGRGDAGDDLIADASRPQRVELFLEPAEDARVSRLQSHHGRAGRGIVDQQPADMLLLGRGPPGPLSDRDKSRAFTGVTQNGARSEIVIEHDVGGAQTRLRLERQEFGIARPGRDKAHESAHVASAIRWKNVPVTRPRYEPVSATPAPFASQTVASGASGCARIEA